jgi:hypothetical protein
VKIQKKAQTKTGRASKKNEQLQLCFNTISDRYLMILKYTQNNGFQQTASQNQ